MITLHVILAILTIGTGLLCLIRPRAVLGFTGLAVPGERGVTEIRAILGGGFIGLGVAPLLLNTPAAYKMLGITYLLIGAGRIVGMVLGRSFERSNWISLAFEIAAGILLLL
jgi:hypothetical protein